MCYYILRGVDSNKAIANREKAKSLKEGDVIKFSKPFSFVIDGIGIKEDTYTVILSKLIR